MNVKADTLSGGNDAVHDKSTNITLNGDLCDGTDLSDFVTFVTCFSVFVGSSHYMSQRPTRLNVTDAC